MFTLFSRSISSLKRRHESDTMLCPAGFDFPTKTSRVLHFLDSSAVCGRFCFFEHIYECLMIVLEEIRLTIHYSWEPLIKGKLSISTDAGCLSSVCHLCHVLPTSVVCSCCSQISLINLDVRCASIATIQDNLAVLTGQWHHDVSKYFFQILKNRPFIPQQPP